MMTLPSELLESLTFAHYHRASCVPYTLDEYDSIVWGEPLLVIDGKVEQDPEPPVRRNASFSVAVPALSTPEEVKQLGEDLVAGGTRLRLSWILTLMDGRIFIVGVGDLRAEEAEWNADRGAIDIRAFDMGSAVADDRFLSPRAMSGGTKRDAAATLLTESVPATVTYTGVPTDSLYPVTWDSERHEAVTELTTALGAWWYWGAYGGWTIKTVPVPTSDPEAADWVVPSHTGVVSSTGSASREQVYNAVSVTGKTPEGDTDPTPHAVVYDDDPSSPTWWDGPFGHRPRFYSSPVLETDAQCESAGESLLSRSRGITRGMKMAVAAHPGLEPGDTISFASGSPSGVFVVDQITLPLDGSPMDLVVRQVIA